MLHWLPSVLSKRQRLFWRLWTIVLLIHVLIIASYAFFTRPKPMVVHVSRALFIGNRPVKVLSMVRQTGQLHKVFEPVRRKAAVVSKQSVAGSGKTAKMVNGKTGVSGHNGLRAAASRVPPKPSRAVTFKKRQEKLKDMLQKKEKKSAKKEKLKQKNKDKKELVSQQAVEVSENKNQIKQQPAVPPVVPLAEPVVQPVVQAKPDQEVVKSVVSDEDHAPIVDEPEGPYEVALAVGDGRDEGPVVLGQEEYELLQAYQAVYEQVSAQWRPPAGIKPARPCIILITLDNRGLVAQLTVEQTSGVLAYDVAARMAVGRSQFPKHMWNEQIRLHF